MDKKLIVIGLDGAHFELIQPWIDSEDLPNIKKCIKEGISRDLDVCLPPVTSPNWKCYSTGKDPAELGIFWWENINIKKRKVYYPYNRKSNHKEIWDYLSEGGYKVLVIGTPLTYPPKKVNGIMIAGGLDCEETGYTYPKNIEKELKTKYNYRIHPKHSLHHNRTKSIKEIHQIIESRFKVAIDLIQKEKFNFIQISTFYINVLQHFLWDDNATKEAWKIIDKNVGKLIDLKEYNLMFMSDHGSNEIKISFNINTWLHKNGYLVYNNKYHFLKILSKLGITKYNIEKMLELFGIKQIIKLITPEYIKKSIPKSNNELSRKSKGEYINWMKSSAIASGQGPIYLLKKNKLNEIKEKLEKVRFNKKKIINKIYLKKEIYNGKFIDEAPDLIIDQEKHIHISGNIGSEKIFEKPKVWKAENKKQGLFIAYGDDLQTFVGKKVSILDLKSIILKYFQIDEDKK